MARATRVQASLRPKTPFNNEKLGGLFVIVIRDSRKKGVAFTVPLGEKQGVPFTVPVEFFREIGGFIFLTEKHFRPRRKIFGGVLIRVV